MFGLGFTEILLIAVIAILFLGPDKLPSTMINVAKFFKSVKQSIGTVKESIEQEMDLSDIKEEVLSYKKELLDAGNDIKKSTDISDVGAQLTSLNDNILAEDVPVAKKKKKKKEEEKKVTFEKKPKVEDTNV